MQGAGGGDACALDIDDHTARLRIAALLRRDWRSVHSAIQHGWADNDELEAACGAGQTWGAALRRESILLCRKDGAGGCEGARVPQRLYVRQSGSCVRVATAVRQASV